MRYLLLTWALVCLFGPAVLSQYISPGAGAAIARLEWARKNRPIESINLHFDKPYYGPGDTLYFKAYVTMNEEHRLTPLSEVLHVDLIDPQDRIIQGIKLQLKGGCAYADLVLPDPLPPGRYRVRAYTRWMLNTGDCYYTTLIVGGAGWTPESRRTDTGRNTPGDIQFFPEGGELVAGVETKVAFKAIGRNGLGVKVKGIVEDDAGNEATRFQSVHLGMGFFYLRPEAGKAYRAKVSYGDGAVAIVALPKAGSRGIALAAENDSTIHVLASDAYLQAHPSEPITLLICSGGGSSQARVVLNGGEIGFLIDKHRMRPGITRVTLFSSRGEPVSERLLFIKGPDSLHLAISTDKELYRKRERVDVRVMSAAGGNFSISVGNEGLLRADEYNEKTILADLLLCSELKGFVEQPNYYFSHSGDVVDANLDLLLLTQGYRHFVWKQLLRDSLPPVAYKAEKYLQIQGFVRAPSGKPVKNTVVTLTDTSGRGGELRAVTDTAGRFVFTNLVFSDTMHFLLKSGNTGSHIFLSAPGGPAVVKEPVVETSPGGDAAMAAYWTAASQEHQIRGMPGAKVLKPVVVKTRKAEPPYYTQSLAGAGNADQVLHAGDIHGGGSLSDALNGRLAGVVIINGRAVLNVDLPLAGLGAAHHMLIVLDGVEQMDSAASLNDIPLSDVETVEVLRSANASIYGMSGGGGVLVITTKRGDEVEAEEAPEQQGLYGSFMGFYRSREFYAPRYDAPATDKTPDLRTTACWRPEIITDKDGSASFSFYTSDLPGTYRMVVEGIGADGNPGRRIYRYKVE